MKRQILLGVLILLAVAGFATADVNVPDPCAISPIVTIQDGIDAAVDGVDEVVVADGTYSGVGNYDLNFWGKAITVKSANGPANCIINCGGMGRAFIFENSEDNNSVVEGFTITNGSANYGGGIECDNSSPTISNCIITGNFASIYGGGVDLYMSSAVITNCTINNNSSNSDGGGINCDSDAVLPVLPPTISFCEIIGNTTVYVGGGVNFYKSSAVVKNCLLKDNVAGDVGGAVYLWDSGPEISNCTIVDNTGSGNFGGIYRETFTGLPTIKNSILWNNGDDLYNCLGLVSYSCVQDDDPGFGNISGDPMFRDGPLGSYYLSQEDANQLATSLCVNRGEGLASNLVGPYSYTTRTDSIADACDVDMGYHYPDSGPVANYLLITTADANGSIDPNHPSPGSPYVQFAEVALTADPCEGYEVQAWTGADNVPAAGEVNNVVTMDANKTVGVTFQVKPTYTLTFTAGANGEIIEPRRPEPYYYKDTDVNLIVEPAPGYRVSHWTGADDLPGWNMNENTVTMTSNKTVTVTFELDFSNIIHVPGDYPEIQLAIDAAVNGDTIVIADGIYPGPEFVIDKNITVTGQTPEDPNLVVIENVEGQFTPSFTLRGAGGSGVCTISGLTLDNGTRGCPDAADGVDPNNDGEDAYCPVLMGGHVRIEGNHIVSNCIIRGHELSGGLAGDGADGSTGETYEIEDPCDPNGTIDVPDVGAQFAGNGGWGGGASGAGIYIQSGSPLIINTIIEDCTVFAGHAGHGGDGSDEDVDDSNFPGSPGGDGGVPGLAAGGGVYCRSGTNPTFENCIIRNNVAVGSYGGNGGDAGETFPDGQHLDHKGGFGGLFALDPNQPAPWTRSALGAGVYVGNHATFTNCRFVNNRTYGAHSGVGGMYSRSWLEDPRRNNYIPGFGAGVYCRSSTNTTFTDCTFQGNETVYGGYPGPHLPPDVNVYTINGPTGFGGAISIGSSAGGTAHSVLIGCNFAENTSDFGGALYGVNSDLRFEDCNFISNLGATGGAMATTGESIAEISGSIFRGNTATYAPGPNQVAGTGGGLFCMETELLASDCIITGNLAYNSGGGVYLGGDLETGNPVLNNCLITDNTAGRTGGGVACDWFVSPIISNCTIADNTTELDPSYGGGLFCTMNSFPRVIDSIIWGNVSINGGQIAVANGDLGFPLPSRLDITYSDVGPRYTYLGFNCCSDAPFAGGGGGGTTLVDGQSIYDQFDAGQDRVKVIVSLFEPVGMKEATDWESPESVSVLRAEIASRQSAVLSTLISAEFTLRHLYENQAGFSGEVTAGGLNKLLSNPSVAYIEPVRYVQPALAQAIPLANALEARQVYDGTGIAVAIVDTGVDYTHLMLGGGVFPNEKVIGGYDFGDGDPDPIPGGIFANTAHGTCCAGIAAGDLGTVGDYIGGVAYSAKICALKATSDDDPLQGFWDDDTLAAWDWCVTHRNDDPNNPIKVMSNSWAIYGLPFDDPAIADAFSPAMTAAADTAVAAGITIMAASGNDGFAGQGISWPSAMSKVISVGAVYDTTDAVTGYSNTADNLDILAPADPVYTTDIVGLGGYDPGNYYPYFNGTSSACPFAAGAVASLQSAALAETESYLTPAQARNLLVVSGDPVTDTKVAITRPRVNLGMAINYLIFGPIYVEEGSTLNGWDWNADSNNWDPNSNNIVEDPSFLVGYYLSQFAAGQIEESNCVDGGHTLASVLGMDAYTTRTDEEFDQNDVDMGYHYPLIGLAQYHLTFTAFDTVGLDPCDQPVILEPIIDPCDGWYNPFRVVELRVSSPPTGSQVLWNGTDNDEITGPNNLVTMYANRVVTVTFLRNAYNLTVEIVGSNGRLFAEATGDANFSIEAPNTVPVKRGTVVELTAYPDEGYRLKQWTGTDNDSSYTITNTVTMTEDKIVTVEFEPPITIEVSGGGEALRQAVESSRSGDTLIVYPGTYNGDINLRGKHITLVSANPDDPDIVASTIIDCQFGSRGITFNGGEDANTIIDGITIINGSVTAEGGGGIYIDSNSSPTIKNVTVSGCSVSGADGGGIYINAPGSAQFINCTITNCSANRGGGAFCNSNSSPIFNHCTFSDNSADLGGGIYYGANSTSELIACTFSDNSAVQDGGALLCDPNGLITIVDCNFTNNSANYGGGLHFNPNCSGTVTGSILVHNDASEHGGAIYITDSNMVVADCNIAYNTALRGGGLYCIDFPAATIIGCTIKYNQAAVDSNDPNAAVIGQGGGVYCFATPVFIGDCLVSHNIAGTSGGGVYMAGDLNSPQLVNCLITHNSAGRDGGGISVNWYSEPIIANCTVIGNEATGSFGEFGNTGFGGGLYSSYHSNSEVIDSIFWNNSAIEGYEITVGTGFEFDPRPATLTISYSDVQGGQFAVQVDNGCTLVWDVDPGDPNYPTNINADPLFVTGPLGDYYLSQTDANSASYPGQDTNSPCVDAGSDLAEALGLRRYTTRTDSVLDVCDVDMGYHYPLIISEVSCDFDANGVVNLADLAILLSYWLEQDCDLLAWCEGTDLDRDTDVDFVDYAFFAQVYESPEPNGPPPADTDPPQPNPSEWEIEPYPLSSSAIEMVATDANDPSGGVQYYFKNVTIVDGSHDSDWQSSPVYTDTGLASLTQYCYKVKTRDLLGNTGVYSEPPACATTLP